MMKLTGPKTIQIKDIRIDTFVRTALNPDQVLIFGELMEGGQKFKPIIVNKKMELVDGRHRLEAMMLLNWTQCEALITDITDPVEIMLEAFRANTGGALPPKRDDIIYVVTQLLKMGATRAHIREQLPFPRSVSEKYISAATKRAERKQVSDAVTAIVKEGLTIPKAAAQFSVSVEAIKEILMSRKAGAEQMSVILGAIETRVRSLSHRLSTACTELISGMGTGDFSAKEIAEFQKKLRSSSKRLTRTVNNTIDRIANASKGNVKLDAKE